MNRARARIVPDIAFPDVVLETDFRNRATKGGDKISEV